MAVTITYASITNTVSKLLKNIHSVQFT